MSSSYSVALKDRQINNQKYWKGEERVNQRETENRETERARETQREKKKLHMKSRGMIYMIYHWICPWHIMCIAHHAVAYNVHHKSHIRVELIIV